MARMLLWLSSSLEGCGVFAGVTGFEEAEEPSSDVAFKAPFDLSGGAALCSATSDVGLGFGVEPHPGQDNGVQCPVELSVTAPVEAVSDRLSG